MSIIKWILLGWFAFGALATIAQIGKPRKSITPTNAVGAAVATCVVCVLVVLA